MLEVATPDGQSLRLLACDACCAHFFENLAVGNYADNPPGGGAALAFYLQQGANMGGMAVRLAALGRPAGTRYLEIGCGFGLGLDIARRTLGWEVTGLDPSPFAAAGRDLLALPIAPRYLLPDDPLTESFDVVHASEVLEHVADPLAMLKTLHRALRADGTLVLTTPAAELITPETGEGLLIPLLSPGWHMVIQTAASLEMLLRRAGFTKVRVAREGAQLIAVAGTLPPGSDGDRAPYLAWLEAASVAVPPSSDLGLGLRARLYRERSAAGDMAAAAAAWDELDAAVAARFGRGIEGFEAAPGTLTLEALVAREPVCLAGVLLHRGLEALQRAEPAEHLLAAAAAAAGRLRAALRAVGSDDGDAEEVAFVATRELIVLAASRGEDGIVGRIEAMIATGGLRHAEVACRACFVTLVNRGALDEARRIDALMPPDWCTISDTGPIQHADASLVYCRAVMELQLADGRRRDALEWLRALRAALLRGFAAGDTAAATILYWPATEAAALGLRMAGEKGAAAALIREAELRIAQLPGFPSRPMT
ncbi:class I SAM-dependent methyltransferase [Roseomonas rosulenta]|uniref:class I SAM-dependent methyltransferase n=1 Tax=Roseomonas rosulenta TaxID=2748667 RepID=UPI0018DFB4D5